MNDFRIPRRTPIIALLLLAPIVSEVLFGGTRISFLFALIPEIGAWGAGALIIRYVARRFGLRWPGILTLGLALGIAEECVIQQTSLAPLTGLAQAEYGRVWGVNWVYFLWALGYWSVWAVLVPIQLVDLIFSGRRAEPWFGIRGFCRACVSFSIASFMAWFMWAKRARVQVFHMPPYDPPPAYISLALAVIAVLAAAAIGLPALREPRKATSGHRAPKPVLAGAAAFLLGLPWVSLVLLGFGAAPHLPFRLVLATSVAWAGLALVLMRRWSSSLAWHDIHRFAAVSGAIAACMVGGFIMFAVGGALPVDWIGKLVLNVAAAGLLVSLGRRIAAGGRCKLTP
jgi:hypothetical protein